MTEERLRYIRNLDSLAPLSDHTGIVAVNELGHVEITRKLSAPIDEFGIPRPEILVPRLLGSMATQNFMWTGKTDEHHMATPKADYTVIRTASEGDLGSAFRGISRLKIDLPRMMHKAAHSFFEYYRCPGEDIMRQALLEIGQMTELQRIINRHFPEYSRADYDRSEQLCMNALHVAIDKMKVPQVDMMPELGDLHQMTLRELQVAACESLRIRVFSDRNLVHPIIRKSAANRYPVQRPTNVAA